MYKVRLSKIHLVSIGTSYNVVEVWVYLVEEWHDLHRIRVTRDHSEAHDIREKDRCRVERLRLHCSSRFKRIGDRPTQKMPLFTIRTDRTKLVTIWILYTCINHLAYGGNIRFSSRSAFFFFSCRAEVRWLTTFSSWDVYFSIFYRISSTSCTSLHS